MLTRDTRRLPGLRFKSQVPPFAETLPRMDVAVFVGFAAAGPLHQPVAVEDIAHFTAIFGNDAPLAWDQQRGEYLYAYLAPAVRAFFGNGGRRCWVIRVAGAAQPNFFAIPGLVGRYADGHLAPAFAPARSEGSWSDTLRVSAALLVGSVDLLGVALDRLEIDLVQSADALAVGELLRLTFRRAGYVLMLPVAMTAPIALSLAALPAGAAHQTAVRATGSAATWFKASPLDRSTAGGNAAVAHVLIPATEGPAIAVLAWAIDNARRTITLKLRLPLANAPALGTQMRLEIGTTTLQLTVRQLLGSTPADDPDGETVQVGGDQLQGFLPARLNSSVSPVSRAVAHILIPATEGPAIPVLGWAIVDLATAAELTLQMPIADAPALEAQLRLDIGLYQVELTVRQVNGDAPPGARVRIVGDDLSWLLPTPQQVLMFAPQPTLHEGRTVVTLTEREIDVLARPALRGQTLTLDLRLPPSQAPALGMVLQVQLGTEQAWLTVEQVDVLAGAGPLDGDQVRVTGSALWRLSGRPPALPATPTADQLDAAGLIGERLSFELWVRQGSSSPVHLSDLACAAGHPRFWGGLPTDAQLYDRDLLAPPERAALWSAAAEPRFPLAGGVGDAPVFLPLGLPALPEQYIGPSAQAGTALERDGLDQYDAGLFLDRQLIDALTDSLIGRADVLRYQSARPRRLTGIHAALDLEEATMIAVPDAIHRGWTKIGASTVPPPEASQPLVRPDWWRFLDCDPPPQPPAAREPQWGNFLNCDTRVIAPPTLSLAGPADALGTFTLLWGPTTETDARYILEESTRPDWSGAVPIYAGTRTDLAIYGRAQGNYYYRVRVESGGQSSDWSDGVVVRVAPPDQWRVAESATLAAPVQLAVQRALLRMCAARGDMLAVLALPEDERDDGAIRYVAALSDPLGPPIAVGASDIAPIGYGEARALSYAAVYHPWLIGREEQQPGQVRRMPPDGAACGVLAARALARGAWIAPANEPLRGVVALTPTISQARWPQLLQAQINLLLQRPSGFVALSADTLSTDPELRPINVRRLLILLRRLALRLGATYVFEPNDGSFRRMVRQGFEAMLDDLLERGAFAGATPDSAYRVIVDSTLNPAQSIDQGRFVVELRVAPALPLTFLTIRLVQAEDRGSTIEER